jgi:hypothetical protein
VPSLRLLIPLNIVVLFPLHRLAEFAPPTRPHYYHVCAPSPVYGKLVKTAEQLIATSK